ncbi:hypothetical protein BD560DRAFT_472668 [Blakeslea trispora]|nr:hypothetical protein BD560DRAFT_472668 [Blakeslea trispora]
MSFQGRSYHRGHGSHRGGFRGNYRKRGGMPMSQQSSYEQFYLPSFTQDPWQTIEHPNITQPDSFNKYNKHAFYLPSFTQDPWQHLNKI